MNGINRWHRGKFEATGKPCEIVAIYSDGEDGKPELRHLVLSDGRRLLPISKGRYETMWEVVVSDDPEAP